ncbi:hypothetical protein D3C81_2078000 [compost metagenome]
MASVTQALQVRGFQDPQRIRAVFFNAPAELFFHHELVEQHDIRGQFTDESIKAAAVELDAALCDTHGRQVGLVLAGACRAAEGNVPALFQECLENLHHVPTGGG